MGALACTVSGAAPVAVGGGAATGVEVGVGVAGVVVAGFVGGSAGVVGAVVGAIAATGDADEMLAVAVRARLPC